MPPPPDRHYIDVAAAIRDGDVVPFLGAGANLVGRSTGTAWRPKEDLPSGMDLAKYLADRHFYPDSSHDLLRVAQFIATMRGYPRLYRDLHDVFDADFPPTKLHEFLARIPALLSGAARAKRSPDFSQYQLLVTTNYDDTLESAFEAEGEPFDLITYKAEGPLRGRFLHWPADEEPRPIEDANSYYDELSLETRTVILKIHGLVVRERHQGEWESFVITEDHYIDYLMHTDLSELLPVKAVERLRNSNLLFLGYALKDWNLRVILQSIWAERDLSVPSWAVQVDPDDFDEEFWSTRDVKIYDEDLDAYVERVSERLQTLLPSRL